MARNKSITEMAILSLLKDKPMYGAEMVEAIKKLSGGVVIMPLPTLYSALHKISEKKLVNSYQQEAEIGGRRRVYNITNLGREYFQKNQFDINYDLLKKDKAIKIEHKTFNTLEDAFSLPLNNQPAPTAVSTVTTSTPINPTLTKVPTREKVDITPYLLPEEKITASSVKHKQMSIGLAGTIGNSDLRPLIKLNAVEAGKNYVVINRLRLFAGIITAVLFLLINFVCSLCQASANAYYKLIYTLLIIYLAMLVAIYCVYPRLKATLTKRTYKVSGLITLGLLVLVIFICVLNQSANLLWLTLFTLLPLVETSIMLLLNKRKFFKC